MTSPSFAKGILRLKVYLKRVRSSQSFLLSKHPTRVSVTIYTFYTITWSIYKTQHNFQRFVRQESITPVFFPATYLDVVHLVFQTIAIKPFYPKRPDYSVCLSQPVLSVRHQTA